MSSLSVVSPNSPRQTAASVSAPTVPTQVVDGNSNSPPPHPSEDNNNNNNPTEQIIEKISNLQDLENQKYDSLNMLLASNPTPDNIAQQKVLISDITQLTNIRAQLFDTLLLNAQNNVSMNNTMNASVQDKHTIVTLKENDLNARRAANAALSQDVENTKRMVDINVYYKKQYEARVVIMKYIVVVCFMVIFFIVLMNLGWLPQEMVIVLVVIIILAGGLYIGSLVYDAYKRSNINYDEYNWGFDSQEIASSISKQPTHKKSMSKDRTCASTGDNMSSKLDSMYKSISSSAASVEDSIKSSSSTLMSDLTPTANSGVPPAPSASSSSISAASTSGTGTITAAAAAALPPSVQSKVSESFMLSKVPRKYFSEGGGGGAGANPFTIEDNYGKI
jgi:hypothetical protein